MYASTSTILPPMPSTSRVHPMIPAATSWTLPRTSWARVTRLRTAADAWSASHVRCADACSQRRCSPRSRRGSSVASGRRRSARGSPRPRRASGFRCPLLPDDRLERVDSVCADVLPEPEEHHPVRRRRSIAAPPGSGACPFGQVSIGTIDGNGDRLDRSDTSGVGRSRRSWPSRCRSSRRCSCSLPADTGPVR